MGGSYIDNLALADRSLGELLQTLDETRDAEQTTLIVSSDHSWRVGIWRYGFGWTKEDELASGHGHFDPRPVLMVRFPGETAPTDVEQPVPLLAMHAMIDRMLAGQLGDAQQLEAWEGKQ
jgi:arylsulfatase A-like enzyme